MMLTNKQKIIESLNQLQFNQNNFDYFQKRQNFVSYQRIQSLGDAVLEVIAIDFLYQKFELNQTTNNYSLMKQVCVSNASLAIASLHLCLDKFLMIYYDDFESKLQKLRKRKDEYYLDIGSIDYEDIDTMKILAEIFEAVIGAIFIDSQLNYDKTKKITNMLIKQHIFQHFIKQENLVKNQHKLIKDFLNVSKFSNSKIIKTNYIKANFFQYQVKNQNGNRLNQVEARDEKQAKEKINYQIRKSMKD